MKYLFLDIDGVLNHEDWYKNKVRNNRHTMKEWWVSCFDPECVERLNNILKETDAKLVVSSSWRWDLNLKKYFNHFGITTTFERTPNLSMNGWIARGEEIDAFLKSHPCDNYVILDDDMDFTDDQIENHLVHCCYDYLQALQEGHEGETGLTERKMKEAISILNSI